MRDESVLPGGKSMVLAFVITFVGGLSDATAGAGGRGAKNIDSGKATEVVITADNKALVPAYKEIAKRLAEVQVPDAKDDNKLKPIQYRVYRDSDESKYVCDRATRQSREASDREMKCAASDTEVVDAARKRIAFIFATTDLEYLSNQCSKAESNCPSVARIFGDQLLITRAAIRLFAARRGCSGSKCQTSDSGWPCC